MSATTTPSPETQGPEHHRGDSDPSIAFSQGAPAPTTLIEARMKNRELRPPVSANLGRVATEHGFIPPDQSLTIHDSARRQASESSQKG